MCSSSPSPPPAPDYAGAAEATASGNLEATRAATAANRINQYTPYGSLTYSRDPNAATPDEGWSATQTLSPEQYQILQRNQNLSTGLLGTAETGLGKVNELLSNPTIDESRLAQMPISGQSVQDAIMSRLEPQIGRQRESLSQNLANQGIPIGSEAWQNSMTDQGQRENDLLTQAALQGINTGLGARQQGIQEQAFLQDRPLNVVNALRTGSQVTSPNFTNVPQQATTTGPNYLGAAQQQGQWDQNTYNQGVGSNNAMMSGLFGLGAAGLMAPTGTFAGWSDRRLKSNIRRIGDHPLGIGIYEYDIFGQHDVGVMADEVEQIMPAAVMVQPSGYKMVNYAMLGGGNA